MNDNTTMTRDSQGHNIKVLGAPIVYDILGVEMRTSISEVSHFLLSLAPSGDWNSSSRTSIMFLNLR